MSLADRWRILDIVGAQVGKSETGHNRGIADVYNRAAGVPLGSPYCCSFCWWAYDQAGVGTQMLRTGSCSALFRWARDHGALTRVPRGGDVLLLRGGPTNHRHAGIVTGRLGPLVRSIEANTVAEGEAEQIGVIDGGGVRRRWRRRALCDFVSVL